MAKVAFNRKSFLRTPRYIVRIWVHFFSSALPKDSGGVSEDRGPDGVVAGAVGVPARVGDDDNVDQTEERLVDDRTFQILGKRSNI